MQTRELPAILYKYTSVENALRVLTSQKLWFSSPQQFNDPFDCNTDLLDFTPSASVVKEFINDKVSGNRALRRKEIAKNLKSPYRIVNQSKTQIQELFYQSGVSCFSALNLNMLMWSHYASSHQGVCLGFDSSLQEIATLTAWVNYQNRFSKVNFWTGKEEAIAHILLSKANDWQYEQEIRLIQMASNGLRAFAAEKLKTVIFGLKTPAQDVEAIKNIINANHYSEVTLKRVRTDKKSFSLLLDDLK